MTQETVINTWSWRGQSLFACRILIALLCIYLIGGDHNNINLGSFKVQVNNKRYLNIPSLTWSSVWRQKTFTEDKTAGGFNGHISFPSWLRTPQNRKTESSRDLFLYILTELISTPSPLSLQTNANNAYAFICVGLWWPDLIRSH